ncbi:MAG: sensor histidine kinase, partial [Thermoleophilaceae bacterium]
ATAMSLAAAAMRHEPGGLGRAHVLESEMQRMQGGLADLDAARAGGRAVLEHSALPLERAVRLAAAGWRPSAARQGRRVSLRWEAGAVAVRADRRRLAQVLGNLLANAVEHGTGTVRLRGRRRGSVVVLEVLDEGPRTDASSVERDGGGTPAEAARVRGGGMDLGEAVRAAGQRGRGLGIAARAAEEAGGSLTVVRTPEGTSASVELPVAGP